MEKLKNKSNIIYILILILISAVSVRIEFQNDTFFSIAVGRQITQTGIDMIEHLTWHTNLMYTYSHWLLDLYNYFVYTILGLKGIYFSVIICTILIALLLYKIFFKHIRLPRFMSFIVTFSVICIDSAFFTARAQVLSYFLFLFEVYAIEKLLETNKFRYKIVLISIPIIIANFHAALFPMYFVLFLPYLAEILLINMADKANNKEIIEKNKTNKIFFKKNKYSKELVIIFVISLFTGLCTPIGSTPYTYMIKTMNDGYSSGNIKELQPTPLIDIPFLQLYIAIFCGILVYKKSRIRVLDLLMFLGLFILALINIRGIAYFILIGIIPLLRLAKSCSFNIDFLTEKSKKYIGILIYTVIFTLGVCFVLVNINSKFINEKKFPIGACDYILENIDYENMRIFNGFNVGSYVEYKGIPSFMDSRSEMYTKAYNDTEIFKDYLQVKSGKITYDELVDKYNLTHLLLSKGDLMDNYMKTDDGYKELYSDDYFVLYEVKRVEAL